MPASRASCSTGPPSCPTYDFDRGEPRGRVKKGEKEENRTTGDCVDCNQCVAVCPTGIDIREGQQEGCITCALCLDACDAVMDKVGRPRGLIRYASLDELEGKPVQAHAASARASGSTAAILLLAISGILYGLSSLAAIELKVLHERAPLFVTLSDGSIQNKYTLKMLNKMPEDLAVRISASGPAGLKSVGAEEPVQIQAWRRCYRATVFVKVPKKNLSQERESITLPGRGDPAEWPGRQRGARQHLRRPAALDRRPRKALDRRSTPVGPHRILAEPGQRILDQRPLMGPDEPKYPLLIAYRWCSRVCTRRSVTMHATAQPTSRSNSPWRSPWVLGWIGLIVVVLAVNLTMVFLAFSTNPGLVIDDYYDRGQHYEKTLVSHLAKDPGWTLRADFPTT